LGCHETIRAGVTGPRLEVMPGCSHLTMNEEPEAYTRLVGGFLRA
jgi:proline iminopeptidase